MLSKREIELDELEEAKYVQSLCDDIEKLQEQLNSKVKALTEIRANIEEHNQIYDLSVDTALLLEGIDGIAFDALAAIGGDGCPAGPVGKNGLTKEEIEGSGDE